MVVLVKRASMELEIAIISNIVTLVVAVIVQFVTIRQTNKTIEQQAKDAGAERELRVKESEHERLENRRIEWKNYLIRLMEKLIEARMEYERFLGTDKTNQERHAGIVGLAIAVCLAVNDEIMTKYANEDLTTHYADKPQTDGTMLDWASRNRNAGGSPTSCRDYRAGVTVINHIHRAPPPLTNPCPCTRSTASPRTHRRAQ
jgi:hypothetical protein